MKQNDQTTLRIGIGGDLAFAVVVLTAYFVTFSSLKTTSDVNILALVSFGIAYIAIGIYGYSFCGRVNRLFYSVIYFILQTLIGGLIVLFGKGAGLDLLILLPLTGHSVILLRSFWVYGVNGLLLGAYAFAVYSYSRSWEIVSTHIVNFLAGQVFIMAFVQMAVNEERARKEVEQLVNNLSEANERLKEYAEQIETLTLTKERARMAREIHDGLGHYLTTINMQLQAATAVIQHNKRQALDILSSAQIMTKEALVEVRRSVFDLRETIDFSESLIERINRTIQDSNLVNIKSEFEIIGEPRHLRPSMELALYRAVQEGTSNIYKHAGATEYKVTLDFSDPEHVGLDIQDNGTGGNESDTGYGLRGLQERVALLDGKMQIVSKPGEGFKIKVHIPG